MEPPTISCYRDRYLLYGRTLLHMQKLALGDVVKLFVLFLKEIYVPLLSENLSVGMKLPRLSHELQYFLKTGSIGKNGI